MYVTLLIWVNTLIIARKYTIKTLAKSAIKKVNLSKF